MSVIPGKSGVPTSTRPSFRRSWMFLGVAVVWATLAMIALSRYHVSEPRGVTSITTNGHTYVGDPPALTLFERDPVSFAVIAVTLGVGCLASLLDVAVRTIQRAPRRGVFSMVAGLAVVLVSLSGLLVGVAGVGVVGALLVASGLPPIRHGPG